MEKPIEEFTSKTMLNATLDVWKKALFLDDWIIKARICAPDEFLQEDVCGENEFDMVNRSCVIRILDKKYYGKRIMKYCAEKILVHELLHCKYNWLCTPNTLEGMYMDTCDHALMEQMAKSLIMVKYGLDREYFVEK